MVKFFGAESSLPVSESSFGMCSIENDVGVIFAASLMYKHALWPRKAQQFPGSNEFLISKFILIILCN